MIQKVGKFLRTKISISHEETEIHVVAQTEPIMIQKVHKFMRTKIIISHANTEIHVVAPTDLRMIQKFHLFMRTKILILFVHTASSKMLKNILVFFKHLRFFSLPLLYS